MFVDSAKFIDKIEKSDFKINRNDGEITFGSLLNYNADLNLACVIEFNKPINLNQSFCNLGNIYFFRTTDLLQDGEKYIYSKNNALSVSALPARYFDCCMTAVVMAINN